MGSESDGKSVEFEQHDEKVDSTLIKKILYEMKSEFNKSVNNLDKEIKEEKLEEESEEVNEESERVEVTSGTDNAADKKEEDDAETNVPEESSSLLPKDDSSDIISSGTPLEVSKVADETESCKSSTTEEVQMTTAPSSPVAAAPEEVVPVMKAVRRTYRKKSRTLPEGGTLKRSARLTSGESVILNAIAMKEKSNDVQDNGRGLKRRVRQLQPEELDHAMSSVVDEFSGSDTLDSSHPGSTPAKNGTDKGSDSEWDKDSSSNFSVGSQQARKKFSFSSESNQLFSAKRQRLEKSPPTANTDSTKTSQNQPSLPTALSGYDHIRWRKGCLCRLNEGVYISKKCWKYSELTVCRGLDSLDELGTGSPARRVVGCLNSANLERPALRPGVVVPFLPLCDSHIARLRRHNACPLCGIFCLQGRFMECKNRHHTHKSCVEGRAGRALCPHCGTDKFIEVELSLGTNNYPLLLPLLKLKPPGEMAKMGMNRKYPVEDDVVNLTELIPEKDLILSRKRLANTPLPQPDKDKLEKFMNDMEMGFICTRPSSRAFYLACKSGELDKVYGMISAGGLAKEGVSVQALHAAAGQGQLPVVYLLVQSGIPLDTLDKSQYTPLMLATLNKHNDVVKYLVKAGANVAFKGSDGMTALHLAAQVGNLEACHTLLSVPNQPLSYVDAMDDGNWTPLVWAAENNHIEVVRYLLERKADPQIRDTEMNVALHWSAFAGSAEISEELLYHGSDVNVTNVHGDTPLHIAARQGADNCVMLLLARGARTDLKNAAGQRAKECAYEHPYSRAAIELNMRAKSLLPQDSFTPKILSYDVSRGRENLPIPCVNNVDDSPCPKDYVYVPENCFTSRLPIDFTITSISGCKCKNMCNTLSCDCSKSSIQSWYDGNGRLLSDFNFDDPPMIFECNQMCECNAATCKNRVVQKGIRVSLQVYKTYKKNWGVLSVRVIPRGTFVCEYVGEIISDLEADTREDDSYLFDLDNRDGESYCIDARKYGNVTRFVNHSCRPNLVPVRVFVSHQDLRFPRIAFFASRDIAAFEELGFDYGDKFWVIKSKKFTCSCGANECRYNSKVISETLKRYQERQQSLDESL